MNYNPLASRIAKHIIDTYISETTTSDVSIDFEEIELAFSIDNLEDNTKLLDEVYEVLNQKDEVIDASYNMIDKEFNVQYNIAFCQHFDSTRFGNNAKINNNYILYVSDYDSRYGDLSKYYLIKTDSPLSDIANKLIEIEKYGEVLSPEISESVFKRLGSQLGETKNYCLIAKVDLAQKEMMLTYNPDFYEPSVNHIPPSSLPKDITIGTDAYLSTYLYIDEDYKEEPISVKNILIEEKMQTEMLEHFYRENQDDVIEQESEPEMNM